ncbi:hypothetical protein Pan265_06760 [Mucisphaera calidilacus]|uniref:Glycosyl hydrolase-like 10 domain-containing protein n=2 Tax=Mucisphaera calidilacus TaxID=2527982 RepID=A0A518BV46_9BACT|nr:hypothetical protein Pan265_06760 [Mucisphaera calidilacus]
MGLWQMETRAEVRGTWLTTTGPDHIRSGTKTESVFNTLRNTVGLNTAYVETLKEGYTQFPSQVMQDLIGVDRHPNLGTTRDLLSETAIQAHRQGMAHIAWFEYGFSPQYVGAFGTPTNELGQWALQNGYLLEDRDGYYANTSHQFAWMNPAVPEVRQLLIDLTLEAIETHDIDGVQLDDRLAWPREFGWDDTTAAMYKAETGRNLPSNVNDSNFRNWRAQKVFEFATQWYTAVKTARPDLIVSVSPSIMNWSFTQFNADWEDWADAGLFDEIVPQVYRNNLSSYRNELPRQVSIMAGADGTRNGRLEDLVIGISRDATSSPTPLNELLQMIQDARDAGTAGHVLWYARGVLDNAEALGAFYAQNPELADSPKMDPGRRPDPLVADELLPAFWSVDVTTPGQYRLVVKDDKARWSEAESLYLLSGTYHFDTELDILGVELLADRRPIPADFNRDYLVDQIDIDALVANLGGTDLAYDLDGSGVVDQDDLAYLVEQVWGTRAGDANLDREVDLLDLSLLAASFDQPGGWAEGDHNHDGIVNLLDLSLLAANFGWRAGVMVPGPAVAWLMLAGLGYTMGRRGYSS